MPIDNTDEALTHSSRRAFLARAAAGGAVAASVGAVGLSGGLGALPALAQEGGDEPITPISATALATSDYATLMAPLELAASQAYLAAITNGRTELSEEWAGTLAQFLRHHKEVAVTLVNMIEDAETAPTADPGVTAQFSPPMGSDEAAILARLAELEEGLAATHLVTIVDLEDTTTAKTVIQISAVEQQQAVALGRAAGVAIADLTPPTASTDGTITAGGTPATPFGETAEESGEGAATTPSADSSGSTSTTEGSESTTTEASETTEAGN